MISKQPSLMMTDATSFWGRHLARHATEHGLKVLTSMDGLSTDCGWILITDDPTAPNHLERLQTLSQNLLRQGLSRRLVYLSSAAICDFSTRALRESAKLAPHNALEQSMADAEALLQKLTKDSNGRLTHTIFRLGDCYGSEFPSLPCPGLVNDYITRARQNQDLPIPGLGAAKRSLLHVKDAAEAIIQTLLLPQPPAVLNLPGENATVIDLALTIADHFHTDATMGCDGTALSDYYSPLAGHRHLSHACFNRTLNFTPQTRFKLWVKSL